MQDLTPEGLRLVESLAQRHGVSRDAVLTLLGALVAGQGTQAQFDHPDLGGMGQWSQGGMIMVGDMFNQALKFRVDSLCRELADLLRGHEMLSPFTAGPSQTQSQGGGAAGVSLFVPGMARDWWPGELGSPASVGAQNNLRYAYFPASRRLAIDESGRVRVYDTGDHRIGGFSQQQSGDQSLTFTSQHGLVRVADLALVMPGDQLLSGQAAAMPVEPVRGEGRVAPAPAPDRGPSSADEILATIERLSDLRQKNILTEDEFSAKKAELLGRL